MLAISLSTNDYDKEYILISRQNLRSPESKYLVYMVGENKKTKKQKELSKILQRFFVTGVPIFYISGTWVCIYSGSTSS